ncbi:hypothetical protein C9374_007461 [Naegleria lovaniensis]|uniref:Uncharacterized protein n=1 Tax=Naegleria lovaniensis TaxID=51637 RepID=A0AA88GKZ6_NAELO|nr:uncharacterized protein C9374_007461 [Naegleria lovaniensis]KAG2379322.1 hypothetical protein C9374_007461 [Naegleria lovaniensis]
MHTQVSEKPSSSSSPQGASTSRTLPLGSFQYMARVFLAAGLGASLATAVVNPLELIKTRMQTLVVKGGEGGSSSMFRVASDIIKQEGGIYKLWTIGLGVSCMRSLLYSSVRIGIYDPVKASLMHLREWTKNESQDSTNMKELPLFWKAVSGLISGALGSALMNPLDVVKIRFQSSGISGVSSDHRPVYKNTWDALWKISQNEGFSALYKGTIVTMIRASILTSAQLSSYDHSKYLLLNKMGTIFGYKFKDDHVTHVTSAFVSGLVTAIAISPVDVIKTKYMNDAKLKIGDQLTSTGLNGGYNGVVDCTVKIIKNEGFSVLFRGFSASYLRLGPHFLLSLPLYEQFRKLFGVSSF